jgi:hypothetical protein
VRNGRIVCRMVRVVEVPAAVADGVCIVIDGHQAIPPALVEQVFGDPCLLPDALNEIASESPIVVKASQLDQVIIPNAVEYEALLEVLKVLKPRRLKVGSLPAAAHSWIRSLSIASMPMIRSRVNMGGSVQLFSRH